MPIEARVALICAKYAVFGIIPLLIPVLFPDVPIPDRADPGPAGDGSRVHQAARRRGRATCSTSSRGRAPGTNIAYFGPEIKIGVPQPALNVDMDALTNVESLSFSFDPDQGRAADRVHPEPAHEGADPHSDPEHQPAAAAARRAAPRRSPTLTVLKDTAKMNPMQAISRGLAEAKKSQDSVSASGSLDVLRYGRPAARRASSSACAAPGSRSTGSTTSRASPARSSAASSSRASS